MNLRGHSLLLFVFLVLSGHFARGVFVDKDFETTQKFTPLYTFGFLHEGTINVQVNLEGGDHTGQWLVGCSREDVNTIGADICNASCHISLRLDNSVNYSQTISKYGVYYFDLLTCDRVTLKGQIHMTLLNPDGEHLSYGYIPLPVMYVLLLMVWLVIAVVWVFNWIKYRMQPAKLNRVITLYPLLKCIFAGAAARYWKVDSISGVVPSGTVLFYVLFYIAEEAVFYTILMVIGTGWGINRNNIGFEKYLIGGIITGLVGTRLLGFLLNELFYLLSFIVYVIIIVTVFRFINKNVYELQIEIRNNPRPLDDITDQRYRDLISAKHKMLVFKVIMLANVASIMMIALFELLFLTDYPWIAEMLREMLEVLMFICVGHSLYLRGYPLYEGLEDENPAYYNQPMEMALVSLN